MIWSNEHRAWWGPGERGYVREVSRAGRYSLARAIEVVTAAQFGRTFSDGAPVGPPPEVIVRLADVIATKTV